MASRVPIRPRVEPLEDRALPSLMGNTLFPADNPWNQRVDRAPVAANSATLVASIGAASSLHPDFGYMYGGAFNGIPYNVVAGTQPKVPVVVDAYASESDQVPVPIPAGAVIEGDPLPADQNTSDRHLLVYDKDNNVAYELFGARRPAETADGQWHASSEAVWDLKRDSFRPAGWTSADAAGLPVLPGLVRADEVFDQGHIDHALRFTVPRSRDAYVFPASHQAGVSDPTLPRMGERFRLRQDFDISAFSPANQVILTALKEYGMIVADNGGAWFLSGAPDPRFNDDDLHNLVRAVGLDFQAVDLTPVVSGVSPAQGPAGTTVTVSGLNFSGGAGQTQVLFGSAVATGLTINSDTSLTVTVPPGAQGTTVDVRVQSPYGTSAVAAADRFTYASDPGGPQGGGVLQFLAGVTAITESGGSLPITVTRTGGTGPVTVQYQVTGGTAVAGVDYVPVAGTLTFADGQTSQTFTVTVLDDTVVDGDRTLQLGLAGPTGGATLGTPQAITITILDNDVPPPPVTIAFNPPAVTVVEGNRKLVVTVVRSGRTDVTTSLRYATRNGTARAGTDYRATSGLLTFTPGQTSKTITLSILDDHVRDGTEYFWLDLRDAAAGSVAGQLKVTILDNDAASKTRVQAAQPAKAAQRGPTDPAALLTALQEWAAGKTRNGGS